MLGVERQWNGEIIVRIQTYIVVLLFDKSNDKFIWASERNLDNIPTILEDCWLMTSSLLFFL